MFLRIFCLLFIPSCLLVNAAFPAPSIYRKAAVGLKFYRSYASHNPLVYSLLNILIHNKHAKAFISDQAIEMALNDLKELDQKTGKKNEELFRELIYGKICKPSDNNCVNSNRSTPTRLSPELAQRIITSLDKYVSSDGANQNASDDDGTWVVNNGDKLNLKGIN
ncbi:unnamed protein product [Rotaria socialis]|uniref:Uncharacterized protein n=1 Tax=Rotaria socialis TaxID=392032 RepID=A0A817NL75_9BILA|nr:unnamed protein product [Rotaria socialis]CAF3374087.1 unnamed protein product [Rotaria socialis]CAF3440893.1 unnamed protein product [Rotaria socialis]CAF3609614.1 unnamed protein product [Rotaria socialis]CAF3659424.1 unnamed protein product [Rotaria socialis]